MTLYPFDRPLSLGRFLLLFFFAAEFLSAGEAPLPVAGAVEEVLLSPPGRSFPARMDTGAALSSLNAYDIREETRDGALWVRFRTTDLAGRALSLALPVVRTVQVRQSGGAAPRRRYIVRLTLRLGNRELQGEFSLADRRRMAYPVLIGRNLLAGNFWVDAAEEYRLR